MVIIQSIIQYVGLCVFSLPTPFVMIERIYILCLIIIIKSEVWTITHCLGLGHETMVCAVCLSTFLCIYKCIFCQAKKLDWPHKLVAIFVLDQCIPILIPRAHIFVIAQSSRLTFSSELFQASYQLRRHVSFKIFRASTKMTPLCKNVYRMRHMTSCAYE